MKSPLALLSLLLMLTSFVYAENCWDTAVSNLEMRECAGQDFQKADKALNQAYQKLIKLHSQVDDTGSYYHAKRKAALIQAELSWIKFRDNECAYVRSFWGDGHEGRATEISCLATMTQKRTKALELYLKDYQENQ